MWVSYYASLCFDPCPLERYTLTLCCTANDSTCGKANNSCSYLNVVAVLTTIQLNTKAEEQSMASQAQQCQRMVVGLST